MSKRAKPKQDEKGNFIKNGASQKSGLNRSILDAGWGMFRTMLEYKTNVVKVDPKFTSQTCEICNTKDAKSRISRDEFCCVNCGHTSHADVNAANIILSRGTALNRTRTSELRLCEPSALNKMHKEKTQRDLSVGVCQIPKCHSKS